MKYSEPLRVQLEMVLVFLGAGFVLGVFYLICTFLRTLLGGRKAVVVFCDLLFCFGGFFVLFSAFLAYTNGVWRVPAIISAASGFLLFRLSVGEVLQRPLCRFADLLRRSTASFFRPMHRCSEAFLMLIHRIRERTVVQNMKMNQKRQRNQTPTPEQKICRKKKKIIKKQKKNRI